MRVLVPIALAAACATPAPRTFESVPPSPTTTLDQADTGAAILGVVTDDRDRPLAGVTVVASSTNGWERRSAQTDARGEYTLADLYAPADYQVHFSYRGVALDRHRVHVDRGRKVPLYEKVPAPPQPSPWCVQHPDSMPCSSPLIEPADFVRPEAARWLLVR